MPAFDVDKEEINAFDFRETYLFTAYFDENQLFNQLKKYYNSDKYRFEVPEEGLKKVVQILDNFFYKMVVQKSPEEYCVVLNTDSNPTSILKNSVMRKQRRNREMFVMKNKTSLRQAVEHGATPLEKSEGGVDMVNRLITTGPSTSYSGNYKCLPQGSLIRQLVL